MHDRLRKVIALMDSSADGEAVAAFHRARALLRQDSRRFRDLLGTAARIPAPEPRDSELLALRERVAELEWHLDEARTRAASAHQGLEAVERHLDGLDRKYKSALDQKDRAIARLRRELDRAARRGDAASPPSAPPPSAG